MQFTSLGSGSKGNCTVVSNGKSTILVDCGFGITKTIDSLVAKGVDPHEVSALFVTHEHGDHIRGVRMLANRFDIPVFATAGTFSKISNLHPMLVNEIGGGDVIAIDGVNVRSVDVPHDALEPTQFVFESTKERFGLLTDIGSINDAVVEHYSGCDSLFVESNHDIDMLWNGNDPEFLKYRVSGDLGHLSNHQAKEFLSRVKHSRLANVVIGHVSQRNNNTAILEREFEHLKRECAVTFATQEEGTSWLSAKE